MPSNDRVGGVVPLLDMEEYLLFFWNFLFQSSSQAIAYKADPEAKCK